MVMVDDCELDFIKLSKELRKRNLKKTSVTLQNKMSNHLLIVVVDDDQGDFLEMDEVAKDVIPNIQVTFQKKASGCKQDSREEADLD